MSDEDQRNELKLISNECAFIISQFRSDFRTQIVHGDLAHYNVIALPEPNGRYTIYHSTHHCMLYIFILSLILILFTILCGIFS